MNCSSWGVTLGVYIGGVMLGCTLGCYVGVYIGVLCWGVHWGVNSFTDMSLCDTASSQRTLSIGIREVSTRGRRRGPSIVDGPNENK